jgi:diguanylate cyclase (GGDEF)-like protein
VTAAQIVVASSAGVAVAAAVAAAFAVVAAGALWLALSRRSPSAASEQWLSTVVSDLDARIEAMQREVAEAVERAQEESRRTRYLGEVAGSIDLDEVLRRTLDAAGAIPGVDAAAISVAGIDGERIPCHTGLAADEVEDFLPPVTLPGRRARAVRVEYDEAAAAGYEESDLPITLGLAVPIRFDLEQLGVLAVFSRGSTTAATEEQLRALEDLALRAGPAIENARRFREARQLADLDAMTELHNRRYFNETLAREVSRAQRYNRRLALLVLDLDNLKSINDRLGHLAGDSVLADAAGRIREVVRSADIPCRVGGDEFAVILPESTLEDAKQLYQRVQANAGSRPAGPAGPLSFSGGVAELRQQDDPVSFFKRADDALYQAKEGGKGRAVADADGDGGERRAATESGATAEL